MSETTLTPQQEQELCRLKTIAFGLKTAINALEEQVLHTFAAEGRPALTLIRGDIAQIGGRNA